MSRLPRTSHAGAGNHQPFPLFGQNGAGYRKLIVDVWLILQTPAINKHAGHGGSYPRCLHNEIPESSKKRMDPSGFLFTTLSKLIQIHVLSVDSQANDHLKKIPENKRLLKDVGQMSPLEALQCPSIWSRSPKHFLWLECVQVISIFVYTYVSLFKQYRSVH